MSTVWLYRQTETPSEAPPHGLYTVGYYGPEGWEPEGDHNTKAAAAARVHYLNGGGRPDLLHVLGVIVANARLIPDPAMDGLTDCYAVPLDDIEAARACVGEEAA